MGNNNIILLDTKQHNLVTRAKYEYSVWEKRLIYHVINRLQHEENPISNLFHYELDIPIAELLKGESKNYHHIKNAAKSLRIRSFELEKGTVGEKDYQWWECGFINYSSIESKTGILKIEVNKLVLPYLVELASNFTTYSIVVAMSLRSIYSQRFYEFCSQFKDTGFWAVSVDKLKDVLKLEGKYALYGEFKKKVIEVAKKELAELYNNGQCDVCFTYTEIKTKRNITDLHFKIKWIKKNKGAAESSSEELQLIADYLKLIWPDSEVRRKQVFKEIDKKKAFREFRIKVDEILAAYSGKRTSDLGGIITKACRDDLGLNF
jgi:plasmid replication initiation protein